MSQNSSTQCNGDQYSQIFSSTFTKNSNSVDKGIDYEHYYISHLLWKLKHEDLENYCISSHNEDFIPFDDVIIETKEDYKPKKEVFAIKFQFVNRRKALKIKDLTCEHGDFNVLKYIEQSTHFPEDANAILYTDASFSAGHGQKITLDLETTITIWHHGQNWWLANCCGLHQGHKIDIRKSNRTLTLYLYSGEHNLKKLQEQASQSFKDALYTDDSSYNQFVNFIYNWSKTQGRKEKLSKSLLERAAALFVLSPFIKPISFSSKPVSENTKLLREAISKVDFSIFDEKNCAEVKTLWRDVKSELRNLKTLNRIRIRYQIVSQNIEKVEDLDGKDEETNKLLWLMGKCPLIVDGRSKSIFAASWLCQLSLVLLSPVSSFFYQRKFFNLADLKRFEVHVYEDIVKKFKCLLQGKEVSLYDLIQECDEVNSIVTTKELLRMVDHPLVLEETKIDYRGCFGLKISRSIIDRRFLNEFSKDTVVIVSCLANGKKCRQFCGDVKLLKVELADDSTVSCSNNGETVNKVIYVSTSNISKTQFNDFCSKHSLNTDCHHFRFDSDECLEWIRSTTGVKDLQTFQLEHYFLREVNHIWNDVDNILVICGTFDERESVLKKIHRFSRSVMWPTLINAKQYKESVECCSEVENLTKYVIESHGETLTETGRKFMQIFLENHKVMIIWDIFDDMSNQNLEKVIGIIKDFVNKGFKQCVAVKSDLKEIFEKELNVLSRTVKILD